jgi:hypothetical protein
MGEMKRAIAREEHQGQIRDRVGNELDIDSAKAIQYCVGPGEHTNYWSDGAVWNAIAFEAFNIGGNRRTEIAPKTPSRSLIETNLGRIMPMRLKNIVIPKTNWALVRNCENVTCRPDGASRRGHSKNQDEHGMLHQTSSRLCSDTAIIPLP